MGKPGHTPPARAGQAGVLRDEPGICQHALHALAAWSSSNRAICYATVTVLPPSKFTLRLSLEPALAN